MTARSTRVTRAKEWADVSKEDRMLVFRALNHEVTFWGDKTQRTAFRLAIRALRSTARKKR